MRNKKWPVCSHSSVQHKVHCGFGVIISEDCWPRGASIRKYFYFPHVNSTVISLCSMYRLHNSCILAWLNMTFQLCSEAQIVSYVGFVGFKWLVAFYAVSSTWQSDINEVLSKPQRLSDETKLFLHPISWNTLKIIIEDKCAYGLGSKC